MPNQSTPLNSNNGQHFTFTSPGEINALDLLAQHTHLSKQNLKESAQKGAVWITRKSNSKPERLRRLKKTLPANQVLDFYYNPELLNQQPPSPTLIADFESYSVWIKPRGMLSQGSKWADHTALYRWIEMNFQPNGHPRQAWIVHRLDRATHGIMLVAHSKKMAATLSRAFEENRVHKTYQAIVWGDYPAETQSIHLAIDNKAAVSHISLLKHNAKKGISLVEITIETGRKHQIRKHLSETGYPILGDRMYGNVQKDAELSSMPNLQLTAYKLCLQCPLSKANQEKCFKLEQTQLDLIDF
ncbi:RluA family pseudouridine synthase [Thiomicrorhabdus sp. Milos-T2]|uniref:RluA family pseudouridine synthase n=1 Tax=Thiomicrorhabdus sp. Milos-T2 TaxID=90814 RepID=UPI000494352C|nr:RNA pseudouridine synthase [Thiomicrorhabdus sp. Milos-T2]